MRDRIAAVFSWADRTFDQIGPWLACWAAFCLPLKLAFAYFFLIPFISLWFLSRIHKGTKFESPLLVPLLFYILIAAFGSITGIDPSRSLPSFLSFIFFALAIPAYSEILAKLSVVRLLTFLIVGQSIAALHSVVDATFPGIVSRLFLGAVTESGQLALVIPVALGVVAMLGHQINQDARISSNLARLRLCSLAVFQAGLLILAGFGKSFGLNDIIPVLSILSFLLISLAIVRGESFAQPSPYIKFKFLLCILMPLLTAALLINLKRGPWLGVIFATIIFLWIYARPLVMPMLGSALLLLGAVAPIRDRLLLSSQHFFIGGGRNTMWHVGLELSLRYPLGIGYNNSPFLRRFALDIPPQHTHFHNNFLNILVETGWLGLAIFLWWLSRLLRVAFRSRAWLEADVMACAIGCSLIAWQIAGLVEYNFGDSEVVKIAFLLIGVLSHTRGLTKNQAAIE